MTYQTHADGLRGLAAFLDYAILGRVDTAKLHAIADDLEAKDRTIAALTAERDRLREAYDAGVPGWMARIDGELITTTLTENPGELAASLNGPHEIVAVRIVEVTEPLTRPDPSAGS